ncbi:MAG: MATE family efflux transporter [Gammaproteobacteria bacterium]|nr:MATE family efflux transporter [Gammaproteobacteria bacterium]MDH5345142.1 MATE family efflux transporter [Gammaproteobacteria bacterium]
MAESVPTTRQEFRTILGISLPLTAAFVAEMGMVITDMIIVGRLGSNELAAVGLAGDWFWVLLLIGMGVLSIIGVFAAQCLGAGDRDGVVAAGEQGLIAAAIASLPVVAGVWFLGPVLGWANQDPEVVRLITGYSRMLAWAVFPALCFVALRQYITALARSAAVGWITIMALCLNVAFNYTLVYGKFGFPALGVIGAGTGTAIVNWLMLAALATHVMRSRHFSTYRPRIVPRCVDRALLGEMFRLGIPISATQFLNGAMFTVAAVFVGMISATTLAAQQIVYSVIYLSLCAAAALGDTVRVRVAYGIGLRSVDASERSANISFLLAGLTTLAATLVLWLIPETLAGIFLDTKNPGNAAVLEISIGLSVYAGMFLLLDGVLLVMANAIRGLRDTRSPLMITMAGYWAVGLGSGVLLCFPLGYGAGGLWWGLVAGVAFSNILMYRRFRTRLADARRALAIT